MFGRLLLLFTLVPALELALLVLIGQRIGTLPTLAIVLATGILGAALGKREGTRAWVSLHTALRSGRLPGSEILEGVLVLLGGALLLTPGVLTDVAGILLLLPPTRRSLAHRIRRTLERRIRDGRGEVEVRYWVQDPPKR